MLTVHRTELRPIPQVEWGTHEDWLVFEEVLVETGDRITCHIVPELIIGSERCCCYFYVNSRSMREYNRLDMELAHILNYCERVIHTLFNGEL